jgi:hypothetical protein
MRMVRRRHVARARRPLGPQGIERVLYGPRRRIRCTAHRDRAGIRRAGPRCALPSTNPLQAGAVGSVRVLRVHCGDEEGDAEHPRANLDLRNFNILYRLS